ncbi:MAG: hypothetical protein HP497_06715 [Nitrospira sp.]|nr:hypothetical protein [Nitrospira sp.]
MELTALVEDIACALAAVDGERAVHKQFQPGIGPFGEADAVRAALVWLKTTNPERYGEAATKRLPDLLIPAKWAVELKVVRPFGDNGLPAEHWSENVLHPYPGNTSSLGDCLKLLTSNLRERKAIIIFGYEHTPPRVPLEPALAGFEILARELLRLSLSARAEALRQNLVHPVHQQLRVYGYEIFGQIHDEA